MKRSWLDRLSYMGIVSVVIYLLFAATAYVYYPLAYSPLTNWLSDLGNPTLNPSGAVFYELAGILTSAALIPFFVSAFAWNTGERKMKILLTVSVIAGVLAATSFMMSAIFPLGINNAIHSFFSILIFIFFGFFETFSASALRRKLGAPRWIVYSGFLAAIVSFAIGVYSFFNEFFLGEWVTVALLMSYVLILVVNFKRLSQKPEELVVPTQK